MARRTSLTLESAEEAAVGPFTQESSREREILALLSGSPLGSEAAVLRALIRLGADTVREQILADGYAAMAVEYRENDDERKVLRKRRAERDASRA